MYAANESLATGVLAQALYLSYLSYLSSAAAA